MRGYGEAGAGVDAGVAYVRLDEMTMAARTAGSSFSRRIEGRIATTWALTCACSSCRVPG